MDERAAERELLLHAAGQRRGAAILERLELRVDRRDAARIRARSSCRRPTRRTGGSPRRSDRDRARSARPCSRRAGAAPGSRGRRRGRGPSRVPQSGTSSVTRMRKSVVLPAPSGPMKPKSSPVAPRTTPRRARCVRPKRLLTTPSTDDGVRQFAIGLPASTPNSTSTGMPIFSTPFWLGTRILTA